MLAAIRLRYDADAAPLFTPPPAAAAAAAMPLIDASDYAADDATLTDVTSIRPLMIFFFVRRDAGPPRDYATLLTPCVTAAMFSPRSPFSIR